MALVLVLRGSTERNIRYLYIKISRRIRIPIEETGQGDADIRSAAPPGKQKETIFRLYHPLTEGLLP